MLDKNGFDLWSNDYDKQVELSYEDGVYPFAGYKEVLAEIYRIIHERKVKTILDLGFGTGVLTKKLYDDGYGIYGIDFSKEMIRIAHEKMPAAHLIEFDFINGLPDELEDRKFDAAVSTYAIHHLTDGQKQKFLLELKSHLNRDAIILLGDVAFETEKDLESAKLKAYDEWDDEESYLVSEKIRSWFPDLHIKFIKKSYCSGVFAIN